MFAHMSCVGLLKLPSNELSFGLILDEMVSHQYFLGFCLKYIGFLEVLSILPAAQLPELIDVHVFIRDVQNQIFSKPTTQWVV